MPRSSQEGPAFSVMWRPWSLPRAKQVTVNVVRASRMGAVWLALACLVLGFAVGVVAGTSGQYRELALWLAGPLGEPHPVRRGLLALDRTETGRAALDARLTSFSSELRAGIDDARESAEDIAKRYGQHALTLGTLRSAIEESRAACVSSTGHVAALRESVEPDIARVRASVDLFNALFSEAAAACRVAAPSSAPPNVETPP